jgi:hypothetical protein
MVLSTIRLPIQWCHPQVQHTYKRRRRQTSKPIKLILLSLLAFNTNSVPTIYSLPRTNPALISTETSNDPSRQHAFVQTVIDNTVTSHTTIDDDETTINHAANATNDEILRQQPFCFIANTDSVPYVLDTGANRIILNGAKLFKDFQAKAGNVTGIGGSPVSLRGTGSVEIPLKADDGSVDKITIQNAVYVPTYLCPLSTSSLRNY